MESVVKSMQYINAMLMNGRKGGSSGGRRRGGAASHLPSVRVDHVGLLRQHLQLLFDERPARISRIRNVNDQTTVYLLKPFRLAAQRSVLDEG